MLIRFVCFACLLLPLGCVAKPIDSHQSLRPSQGQALTSVYLTTSGSFLNNASFTIDRLALFKDDAWLDLGLPAVEVDRSKNLNRQLLLGVALAPAGEHRRFRFRVTDLTIDGFAVPVPAEEQMVELVFPEPVYLDSRESKCIFVDWSLESSSSGVSRFQPVFTAQGQQVQLGSGLAYIACDDIDTVYIVQTATNNVVASFAVPGPLADMQIDARRRRLYVLSSGHRSIYVYDCVNGRLLERIALPRTVAPGSLALDGSGQQAYVTDADSSLVLKVGLNSGVVTAQQRVQHRPSRVIFFEDGTGRLAVLSAEAQQLSVLDADQLVVQRTVAIGQDARDLLFFDDLIYVTERATNVVALYEYQTGRLRARIPVGFSPQDLLLVDSRQVLVSNRGAASLSVLVAGQETSFRRIAAGGQPSALALSSRRQLVYVANLKDKTVEIVDLIAEKPVGELSVGGTPRALAILD